MKIRALIIAVFIAAFSACEREERTAPPNLVTLEVREISSNSARSGGHVYGDGNREITRAGIVWSSSPGPSIENNTGITGEEPGLGTFMSYMTGLQYRVQYFVRAYAVNSEGTSYGEEVSFITACEDITVSHSAGDVAPESTTVTYRTIKSSMSGEPRCWIIQNLGAERPASSPADDSPEAAGWYWQFNNKRGYLVTGALPEPGSEWIIGIEEDRNWLSTEDPCALLLGHGWRLPTGEEWETVHREDGWNSSVHAFESELRVHAAGLLDPDDGTLIGRGVYGAYWTGSQYSDSYGKYLYFYGGSSTMFHYAFSRYTKSTGMTLRCVSERLY